VTRAEEFEELRPLLFAIAYRILSSVSEAEDAVQETWLAYQAYPTPPVSTKALLSTIVTRISINVLRSARRRVMDFSPAALRAIGTLELLAAAGLILPAVLDIAPILVPVTATCVALLFIGAATMRLRRGERATVVGDLVYLAMAVFVAWGRFGPASFTG
jgi:hypothetical protein